MTEQNAPGNARTSVKVRVDDVELGDGTPSFVGDIVKVLPTKAGGRDGYLAVIRRVVATTAGVEVDVAGIGVRRACQLQRTYLPTRLRAANAAELRTVRTDA